MYARIARFRRAIFAGFPLHLMLALICTCAITLGAAVRRQRRCPVRGGHALAKASSRQGQEGNGSKNKTPAIVTESGPLKGIINGNITEFLGIPYAAPPVGNLRWMPPQSFGTWHGLLDASNFGNVCTQGGGGSEDCLFLNIYVPNFKKNGNKHGGGAMPVMFWIHGGGLTGGAGSDYDPTPLVNQGVIVVTINYRLGYLGFFAQTALDSEGHDAGNYGLMDQQFAMKWVQRNIGAVRRRPEQRHDLRRVRRRS